MKFKDIAAFIHLPIFIYVFVCLHLLLYFSAQHLLSVVKDNIILEWKVHYTYFFLYAQQESIWPPRRFWRKRIKLEPNIRNFGSATVYHVDTEKLKKMKRILRWKEKVLKSRKCMLLTKVNSTCFFLSATENQFFKISTKINEER